ncbi:hypothetical protein HNQ08_003750 [Deinococcus humi]|uniref:Uncharacterized protein n=1 Tax=Deinococcus humi TaxID=662880 RepID=A0A7W8NI27_9DEIO|nr:hypothetical protein [Deinococcus humi]
MKTCKGTSQSSLGSSAAHVRSGPKRRDAATGHMTMGPNGLLVPTKA